MAGIRRFLGKVWEIVAALIELIVLLDILTNPPRVFTILFSVVGEYASGIYFAVVLILLVTFGILCARIAIQHAPLVSQWLRMKVAPTRVVGKPESQTTQGLSLCREENRPQVEVLLDEAERNSTIWVMGVDCTYWLDDCAKIVKDYVTKDEHNLSFIFIVPKPTDAKGHESEILKTALKAGLISIDSRGRIEGSISKFQKMRSELKEKGDKIQLGIHDLPLVHSMVVVNPGAAVERIQVTHHLCEVPWRDRPNLTLRKQLLTNEQRRVFGGYHDSILYALKNARDLDGKPLVV